MSAAVAIDTTGMYWEDFDDQSSDEFKYVGYVSLRGEKVTVPVEPDLDAQVAEIRRCNGRGTTIRVYR